MYLLNKYKFSSYFFAATMAILHIYQVNDYVLYNSDKPFIKYNGHLLDHLNYIILYYTCIRWRVDVAPGSLCMYARVLSLVATRIFWGTLFWAGLIEAFVVRTRIRSWQTNTLRWAPVRGKYRIIISGKQTWHSVVNNMTNKGYYCHRICTMYIL